MKKYTELYHFVVEVAPDHRTWGQHEHFYETGTSLKAAWRKALRQLRTDCPGFVFTLVRSEDVGATR